MNVKGIIELGFMLQLKNKLYFIVRLLICLVVMYLINNAILSFFLVNKEIITVSDLLDPSAETVFRISFSDRGVFNEYTSSKITAFVKAFCENESIDSCVYYFEETILKKNDNSVPGLGIYMYPNAVEMHRLKNVHGDPINFDGNNSVVVGYNYRECMPIGTCWRDSNGKSYVVTDVLSEGERWFGNLMLGGTSYYEKLDNAFIMSFDEKRLTTDQFFGFVIQNGVYYLSDNKDLSSIKEEINSISVQTECPVTIVSAKEMIKQEIYSYINEYKSNIFSVLLVVILSFIGIVSVSFICLERQKRDILIMHCFGVSKKNHLWMQWINHFIPALVSGTIVFVVWKKHVMAEGMMDGSEQNRVASIAFVLSMSIVMIAEIPILKRLYSILNGKEVQKIK